MISQNELNNFLSVVAKRRVENKASTLDKSAFFLFEEYLIKSISIFDRFQAAGWPFRSISDFICEGKQDWSDTELAIERVVERVVEGGVYRQILVMNCLKWDDITSKGCVPVSMEEDPHVPLVKFLATGAPVNREHLFVDVGSGSFLLDPALYRA